MDAEVYSNTGGLVDGCHIAINDKGGETPHPTSYFLGEMSIIIFLPSFLGAC
ncbi:hypothetical protein NIES932_15050 [Raphidiopsis curvata NIES-932]|nr:hypothetical protein NIES932_15050 [Raphidiopsis curvata NIES-932]